MKWIYKIPIVGDLIHYAFYFFVRLIILPLSFWASGGQRLKCGKCIIWTPGNREQSILDGFEFIRAHDPQTFLNLTGQRLIFFYSQIATKRNGGNIYGLDEQLIKWGTEGVATSIIEAFFMFKASSGISRIGLDDDERAAVKSVSQNVLEWMREHSIQANLISAYRLASEKWILKNKSYFPS